MTTSGYLVGRGIADVTGEAADCGMLGYGKGFQQTAGIHTRLRSRAFVIADAAGEQRVLLVVSDLPMMLQSVHQAVLARLAAEFGEQYNERNVQLTVTHTHCGPGGYSHHGTYNSNTHGFRPKTFNAIVDGIVEAARKAHADLAPATLMLAHGALHDASINRSRVAFERNPQADKDFFPAAVDPQTSVLRIERDGRPVGVINWFATHNTSMTNRNRLISSDNKGYAALHWERHVEGVDYLTQPEPDFIAAFAQTNAGDMSPNLNYGWGPTADEFENTRIIGTRQYEAAAKLLTEPGTPVTGGVSSLLTYVNLSEVDIAPEFTGDGSRHRTSAPYVGAASLAGTDEGAGFQGFRQEVNPFWDTLSAKLFYRVSPRLRDAQAPKALVLPAGLVNKARPMIAEIVPVQLLRIGPLYLIGIPGEVTIVAGLRLRRTVAEIVGANLRNVLVAGYSNGYIHYVTTPEEYDAQRYEGGSTFFGRWELPALQQTAAQLATAMRDGRTVPAGPVPPDLSAARPARPAKERAASDVPKSGKRIGDMLVHPAPNYSPGAQVRVAFTGVYPNNDLRRGGTYLEVQRAEGPGWVTVADDGDWSTKFHWADDKISGQKVTITWDIPVSAVRGRYRVRYHGDARDNYGHLAACTATSTEFTVE